jgi:hypothetical protein
VNSSRAALIQLVRFARAAHSNYHDLYQVIVRPEWNCPFDYLEEVNCVIRHGNVDQLVCTKAGRDARALGL